MTRLHRHAHRALRQQIKAASLLWLAVLVGCAGPGPEPGKAAADRPQQPECKSLLGRPLYAGEVDPDRLAAVDAQLSADPDDLDLLLEKGLLLEEARHFTSAIALYSTWLAKEPGNVTLLRRRGHRYINVRNHGAAIADLRQASRLHRFEKVESLGYKDNLNWAICYYLGLALALDGDLEAALSAFQNSHSYSADKVALLASTNWMHNLLRRLGRPAKAEEIIEPIKEGMGYSGNYYNNILVYKGLRQESDVFDEQAASGFVLGTVGYGMANWRRANGDAAGADRLLHKVANAATWHSNGVMAAEAELARRQ